MGKTYEKIISVLLVVIILLNNVDVSAFSFSSDRADFYIVEQNDNYEKVILKEKNGDTYVAETYLNGSTSKYILKDTYGNIIEEMQFDSSSHNIIPNDDTFEYLLIKPYSWSEWNSPTITRGHTSFPRCITLSSAVTIIVGVLGGGITYSLAAGIAAAVVNEGLGNLWYVRKRSYRHDYSTNRYQGRDIIDFYRDSAYRDYIRTETSYWYGDAIN